MRITGGELARREFRVPRAGVRPTQERVREALFSMLATRLAGARVLDLFAGSGSLGLEAWSRGAGAVWWVEQARPVLKVLRQNVEALAGSGPDRVVRAEDVARLLHRACPVASYDIALADPPYEREREGYWLAFLLERLAEGGWIAPDGILAFEQAGGMGAPAERSGWELVKDRSYGDTRILVYRRTGEAVPGGTPTPLREGEAS